MESTQFQQVFASDIESDSRKSSLTLNVHLANSCDDITTYLGVDEYCLFDELISTERRLRVNRVKCFMACL